MTPPPLPLHPTTSPTTSPPPPPLTGTCPPRWPPAPTPQPVRIRPCTRASSPRPPATPQPVRLVTESCVAALASPQSRTSGSRASKKTSSDSSSEVAVVAIRSRRRPRPASRGPNLPRRTRLRKHSSEAFFSRAATHAEAGARAEVLERFGTVRSFVAKRASNAQGNAAASLLRRVIDDTIVTHPARPRSGARGRGRATSRPALRARRPRRKFVSFCTGK